MGSPSGFAQGSVTTVGTTPGNSLHTPPSSAHLTTPAPAKPVFTARCRCPSVTGHSHTLAGMRRND